jgi:hypothetical protein
MPAIVMVAALAAAVPLVAADVPVVDCPEVLLDPPHAVANAATRHVAAKNKPNLFIVTPLDWTLRKTRLPIRIGSKRANFAVRTGPGSNLRDSGWPAATGRQPRPRLRHSLCGPTDYDLTQGGSFADIGPDAVCGRIFGDGAGSSP